MRTSLRWQDLLCRILWLFETIMGKRSNSCSLGWVKFNSLQITVSLLPASRFYNSLNLQQSDETSHRKILCAEGLNWASDCNLMLILHLIIMWVLGLLPKVVKLVTEALLIHLGCLPTVVLMTEKHTALSHTTTVLKLSEQRNYRTVGHL